jgi:hypothetical protein
MAPSEPWFSKGLRDLAETRGQVHEARGVLLADGQDLFDSLDSGTDLLTELVEANALRWSPDPPPTQAWQRVIDILQGARVAVLAATTTGHVQDSVRRQLTSAATELDSALLDFLTLYKTDIAYYIESGATNSDTMRAVDRAAETIAARRLVAEARETRDQVKRVLRETQRAAGVVGETRLAAHFAAYARRERRIANVLRVSSIAAALLITMVAGVLLLNGRTDSLTTAQELAHIAVALPLAALAAYFGRESARHRTSSKWADELEIQLLTFDAFCEPLDDAARTRLRSEFGRRVFLTNGPGTSVSEEVGPSTMTAATDLLEQAMVMARRSS